MAWRRGSLPILGALLLVMVIGFALGVAAQTIIMAMGMSIGAMQAAIARGLDSSLIQTTLALMNMVELVVLVFGIALALFVPKRFRWIASSKSANCSMRCRSAGRII